MTREAVRRRLGQLEVAGGGTWRGRYSNIHDPDGRRGDFVRLVIIDPAGKEQTTRDLPLQGESCDTMAQAIALVVDGFFRDLSHAASRDEPLDPPNPSAVQQASAVPSTQSTTSLRPSERPAPPPERQSPSQVPRRWATGPELGAAYESATSSPAFSLGWYFAVTPIWRLDLRGALPSDRVEGTRHSVETHALLLPMRFTFSYTPRIFERLQALLGPEVSLSLERGSADPRTSDATAVFHSGWRASFGVGARAGAAYWFSRSWAVALTYSVSAVLLQSRRFLVYKEPVLELPSIRMAGVIELCWAIFP